MTRSTYASVLEMNEDRPAASESDAPATGTAWSWIGWGLVILLLLVQWGLFRQFAIHEMLWNYPQSFDQLQYLTQSYETYERVLHKGLSAAMKEAVGLRPRFHETGMPPGASLLPPHLSGGPGYPLSPNGMMMPIQGSLLFLMAGPDRLSALSMNFFYWAIFQVVLVATLLWLSGRWSIAFIGLGLMLVTLSPMVFPGGMFDFRLDFIGMCLFGTLICLVIRSGVFVDWRWSIAVGFCAVLLITFRYITGVYLAGMMLVMMLAFLGRLLLVASDEEAQVAARQVRGAMIACAIILAVCLPILISQYQVFRGYYWDGHFAGPEREVRAREQGITSLYLDLIYYPTQLVFKHAGVNFFRWSVAVVEVTMLIALLTSRWRSSGTARPIEMRWAIFFAALGVLVPLAILTRDIAKSEVVADIMVPPLVLLVMLAVIAILRSYRGTILPVLARAALIVLAAAVLGDGISKQALGCLRVNHTERDVEQTQRLYALYDQIAEDAIALDNRNPVLACDLVSDAINFQVLQAMTYERHGHLLDPGEALANTILDVRKPNEVLDRLGASDFVILTEPPPPTPGAFIFPFETRVAELRPTLRKFCQENFVQRMQTHLFGRDVTLYERPAVKVQGTPDGWATADEGLTIEGLNCVLRARPTIHLTGENELKYIGKVPHVKAVLERPGQPPLEVSAEITNSGSSYFLTIHLDPASLPQTGVARIHASFDAYFVPHDLNLGSDTRRFVMRTPIGATLTP